MEKVSNQNDVLKLVRAGGIVELYKHPIKAAQIMERYPRHCVTRPDFFRNPYIVVKPESVLKPGQVFFIVPYHTIYRLLKCKGYRYNRHYTTKPGHNETVKKQSVENIRQMENMIDTSFFHQLVAVENIKNKKQNNRQAVNFSSDVKRDNCAFKDDDWDYDNDLAATSTSSYVRKHKKGGQLKEACKDTARSCLKPCLRKKQPTKTPAQQGLRVRFMLPDEKDEKWDDGFPEF